MIILVEPEAKAVLPCCVSCVTSEKQWVSEIVFALTKSNSIEDWKQAIVATLERQSDKQCSLLSLMTAAKLQSRCVKHPFNDALSALVNEQRVLWSNLPGKPIRIIVL